MTGPRASAARHFQTIRTRLRDERFRREVIALAAIVVLAFGVRVLWLGTIPGNITADEVDNLRTVFRIQVTGDPGPFGLDWKPQPAMSMYLFSGFMALFGNNIFGMRMASAVLSTLALLPFYALARRVVQPIAALGGTALLASGLWYLNFSRSGWENVHTAFYALTAAWALTVALERRQLRWFALAGVASALGLYGYFSGRFILVALLVYAPIAVWMTEEHRLRIVAGYGVLIVTVLVLFTPQVPAIADDFDRFNRRTVKVNVLSQPRPYKGEESDLGILKDQAVRNAQGFFLFDGDVFSGGFRSTGRYGPRGETLYDPVTGTLLIAGLVIGLWRWRETRLWWMMLFVPLIATQIPSTGTPNGARAVMVAPFLYLFITLALDQLIALADRHTRRFALVGVVALVVALSVANVYHYFTWIESPDTLEAREPAVKLAEFDSWRDSLIDEYSGQDAEGPLIEGRGSLFEDAGLTQ